MLKPVLLFFLEAGFAEVFWFFEGDPHRQRIGPREGWKKIEKLTLWQIF